jgi:hypothetical protein
MNHPGPRELLVIVFPGTETPTGAAAVLHAVDVSDGIRTVAAAMIVKDDAGRVRGEHLPGPGSSTEPTGPRTDGTDQTTINTTDIDDTERYGPRAGDRNVRHADLKRHRGPQRRPGVRTGMRSPA